MDEPFSALDPLIRSRLQDELLSLQARVQKTILFVTHDMNEALRLGNQVSILDGGRIVQTGTVRDIVTRPCNDYVAAFVRHMNPLTVLTAAMVMQPLAELSGEQSWVWLDAERRLKLQTDPQGRATRAWRDGVALDGAEIRHHPWRRSASAGGWQWLRARQPDEPRTGMGLRRSFYAASVRELAHRR